MTAPQIPANRGRRPVRSRLAMARRTATEWLARNSVSLLRISLGLVFLGFGALKFFSGVSPAQGLAIRTVETLTFGIIEGQAALLMTAVVETLIGVTMITGRLLTLGLAVLGFSLIGIMSPVVLFYGDMFLPGGPTLQAQYVLKDVVLAAAGLVIAARVLGARLVPTEQRGRR